jgi:hypothetical protein
MERGYQSSHHLVRSQMVYPAELRAHCGNDQRRFRLCGNSRVNEDEGGAAGAARRSAYSKHLIPSPTYFLSHTFHKLLASPVPALRQRKSFSPLAIPTRITDARALYFQVVGIGKSGATIIGRRSGAQRGALEDKLRPEVFLDAPCIFPSTPV